jgi:hypothetical protein
MLVLEKKYFINQFDDITPTKFLRRQRFLRHSERKLEGKIRAQKSQKKLHLI